jgi:PAS domain S-box-containing protein
MDQSEVLAPIRTVLWKLGAVAALVFLPMLGVLLWSTRRMTETDRALATEVAERTATEQRFRQVFESVPYGMIMVNQAGLVQLVNAQAEQLFGYTRDELLGQPIELLVPEASRPRHVTDRLLFQASSRTRSMGAGRDLRARRKDGAEVPVEIALVPLYLHDVPGVLATIVDISVRKRAEEALRTAQAQLLEQHRREKEQVEAELARMRDVLVRQTRLAAIGELAAGIAHDLRNPLGAIRNACHLLKRRVPAEDRKGAEYVRIVEEEVTASDRIISNLLDIARGKRPSKASVSLASVVEKAFQQARPASTIRRRLTFEPDPFMVWGDPTQLQQIFHNLILNAAQAMGTGGEIRITARHAGGEDEILVADDGPGIPAAQRAQIFEPLFTTKADGTGLGFTICRQLIERHGGVVELLEGHHPGTAFVLRLPQRPPAGGSSEHDVKRRT